MRNGLDTALSVPKKPLTAYAIFVKKTRKEYIDVRGESKDNNDMMKELGRIWSNLDLTEKKYYEIVASEDKIRYERELKEFEEKGGTKKMLNKNEKKPKKCLSAYMIFVREMRPRIVRENPDMKVLHVMKEVGR